MKVELWSQSIDICIFSDIELNYYVKNVDILYTVYIKI